MTDNSNESLIKTLRYIANDKEDVHYAQDYEKELNEAAKQLEIASIAAECGIDGPKCGNTDYDERFPATCRKHILMELKSVRDMYSSTWNELHKVSTELESLRKRP